MEIFAQGTVRLGDLISAKLPFSERWWLAPGKMEVIRAFRNSEPGMPAPVLVEDLA